ncbi:MAG: TSUP family transporter [Christensenellales bacterium]
MNFIWYLLLSILSGALAGMGMGGGTLLIPILTIIMKVEQNVAQGLNLLVFVPCALICCIIYTKNKLINYKKSWLIVIVAIGLSVLSSLLAIKVKNKFLSICFGTFLIALGLLQLIIGIINMIKDKKQSGYIAKKEL